MGLCEGFEVAHATSSLTQELTYLWCVAGSEELSERAQELLELVISAGSREEAHPLVVTPLEASSPEIAEDTSGSNLYKAASSRVMDRF